MIKNKGQRRAYYPSKLAPFSPGGRYISWQTTVGGVVAKNISPVAVFFFSSFLPWLLHKFLLLLVGPFPSITSFLCIGPLVRHSGPSQLHFPLCLAIISQVPNPPTFSLGSHSVSAPWDYSTLSVPILSSREDQLSSSLSSWPGENGLNLETLYSILSMLYRTKGTEIHAGR